MDTMQRKKMKNLLTAALPYALLLLSVCAAFWRAPFLDYVYYDDKQYISGNPMVADGLGLRPLKEAFTSTYASNWHPLTWISHQLDVSLFGLAPAGHHVVNVLLHLCTTLLLYVFLRCATRERFTSFWPAFFAAAFFAVHPLRVESVAWLAERKDVLSSLFWVAAMLFHLLYARSSRLPYYAATCGAMAFGLLAKPMLVTLPLALLILDYWPLGRMPGAPAGAAPPASWRRLFLEKLPLLLMAGASSWITMIAQQTAMGSWEELPLSIRIANALQSYVRYVGKMVWPGDLIPYYPHAGHTISWSVSALCGTALLGACAAAWVWRKRAPWFAAGWSWYLLTLVPVIGVVQVGGQAMADRYTYIPSIGIAAALCFGIAALLRGRARASKIGVILGLCLILALGAATQRLTWYWRGPKALFSRSVAIAPSDLAHNNLANAYAMEGNLPMALHHFYKGMQLNPINHISPYNAGHILLQMGQPHEAIPMFERALRCNPDIPEAHAILADLYADQGQPRNAVPHLQILLAHAPPAQQAEILNKLGVALAQSGDTAGARAVFARGLRLAPQNAALRANMERLERTAPQ